MLCTDGPRRDKVYLLYLQTGMPNLGLKGNRCRHESEYRETRGEGERERERERKKERKKESIGKHPSVRYHLHPLQTSDMLGDPEKSCLLKSLFPECPLSTPPWVHLLTKSHRPHLADRLSPTIKVSRFGQCAFDSIDTDSERV